MGYIINDGSSQRSIGFLTLAENGSMIFFPLPAEA
jgi:hypothetical protein